MLVRALVLATLQDAEEEGYVVSRHDLADAIDPIHDYLFGSPDPSSGVRTGGLRDEVKSLKARSSTQLIVSSFTAAAVPIAVAIIMSGG